MILFVDAARLMLTVDGVATPCIIGGAGACAAEAKREGDGRSPCGRWQLRSALVRTDRVAAPDTGLSWRAIDRADGWSDDPADPAYNTAVRHPHPFSAEHLWRDDGLYDVIVTLGYNDAPVVPGRGSAIFLHCSVPGHPTTAGCIAIARDALVALLPWLTATDWIDIA